MADALVVEFEVRVPPAHAFAIWTSRCASWWPARHTVTGDPAAIEFEPRPGGRIFERGRAGDEHDWGEVVVWDPPTRLRYRWHLFFEPDDATEVDVTFSPVGGRTAVRLEHRGFDALGPAGPPRRNRTREVWSSTIAPCFAAACRAEG